MPLLEIDRIYQIYPCRKVAMLEALDEEGVLKLGGDLTEQLGPFGFELHPFLVGWYNQRVGEKFLLDFPSDTLAFVVICASFTVTPPCQHRHTRRCIHRYTPHIITQTVYDKPSSVAISM